MSLRLPLLGGLSLVLYAALVPLSWVFPARTLVPLRQLVGLDGLPWVSAGVGYAWLAAVLGGLVGLYLLALRSPDRGERRGWAIGVPLAATALLLVSSPFLSHDIFLYLAYGRMATVLGMNPYVHTVGEAWGDPIAAVAQDWGETRAPYGPVWLLVTAAAATVAGSAPTLILVLRGIAVGGYLLGFLLVDRLARAVDADRATVRLAYAWNPLLILETAGNGHHEAILLALILLALLAHRRRGPAVALPVLALSALLKPIGGFLAPLYLAWAWRGRPALRTALALGIGAVVSLGLVVVAYVPYWAGPQVLLGLVDEGAHFGSSSLPEVLRLGLVRLLPARPELAPPLTLAGTSLPVAGFYLLLLWRTPKTPAAWLGAAASLLLVYLVTASSHLRQWYFVWPLVLAAPLAGTPIGRLTIAFSAAATIFYVGPGLLDRPILKLIFTAACFALPGLWLLRHIWQTYLTPGRAPKYDTISES
ncbi:MAG: hypothetical protein HY331_06080 [Chloroflexi bacterium]|nr:hypothetical protein [Chloroflexota bacterium]